MVARRPRILVFLWIFTDLCCKEVIMSHTWTVAISPSEMSCLLPALYPWPWPSVWSCVMPAVPPAPPHPPPSDTRAFQTPLLPQAHLSSHFLLPLLCYIPKLEQHQPTQLSPPSKIPNKQHSQRPSTFDWPLNLLNTLTPTPKLGPDKETQNRHFKGSSVSGVCNSWS